MKRMSIPPMPVGVASLLRRCFELDPANRPHTLRDCAAALAEEYRAEMGTPYRRVEPQTVGDTADALNNRALSMLDLGKSDQAETLFGQALELDRHHVAATYNRGLLRWRAAECTDADVLVSLREIEREHPGDARLQCALAWVKMERADFAGAHSHFERAIGTDEDGDARQGLEQAQTLAERTAGYPRNFEGQTGSVGSIAFAPDGTFALSGQFRRPPKALERGHRAMPAHSRRA